MRTNIYAGTRWVTFEQSKYGKLARIWIEVDRDDRGLITLHEPEVLGVPKVIVVKHHSKLLTEEEATRILKTETAKTP